MLDIINFPLFLLSTFIMCIVPGPDIAYVVSQSIAHGRAAGMLSALGVAIGGCCHALACALGLTAIIVASPMLFMVIQYLGAAYLIYLGSRIVFNSLHRYTPIAIKLQSKIINDKKLLIRGIITSLTNPKVLLFFVAFFPQFVPVNSPNKALSFLILGMVYTILGLCTDLTYAWLAGSATKVVNINTTLKNWIDRVIGLSFISIGVRLALIKR